MIQLSVAGKAVEVDAEADTAHLDGRAIRSCDFSDYPMLRVAADIPKIDVHISASSANPGGVGEPGVPPLGRHRRTRSSPPPASASASCRSTRRC